MATTTKRAGTARADDGPATIDPRAPRFGQTITAVGLGAGVVFGEPTLVFAVTAVLVAAVASRWRYDLYGFLFRHAVRPLVGPPGEPEPASPPRFAKLLGAAGTSVASLLLLAGFPIAGYAVAAGVAIPAGIAAATDVCIGCRMYRQVAFFRRIDVV